MFASRRNRKTFKSASVRRHQPGRSDRREGGRKLSFETLEDRRLLAGVAEFLVTGPSTAASDTGQMTSDEGPARRRHELVVIDAAVPDYQQLVQDVSGNTDATRRFETAVIPPRVDGIAALSRLLGQYRNLDAVHIVSHGQPGAVQLGQAVLNAQTLPGYADSIRGWSSALEGGADILLYGCDVAADADGRQLVEQLRNVTGADVVASSDTTGRPARGGDWDLEYAAGPIETAIAISPAAQSEWDGRLLIVQEYYIPIPEGELWTSFHALYTGTGTTMDSTIAVVPAQDNAIVYYDHWEDGYEANIESPGQATTEVWGDNSPANGMPPGFATDVLTSESVITLRNDIVVPRSTTPVLYDGSDRIATTKGLAVTRAAWAIAPGTVLAAAVGINPVGYWGTSYVSPIGQNAPHSAYNQMFEYVSLLVMAATDGTTISIDHDGDGTIDTTQTLSRGQSYQVDGNVLVGASVTSNNPVQVHLVTGDRRITAGIDAPYYETRCFTLTPRSSWGTSYYTPVGTTTSTYPAAVFLYNPHATAIAVTIDTLAGQQTVSVPATTDGTAHGLYRFHMPLNSGAHFQGVDPTQAFSAIGAMDAGTNDVRNDRFDWGYTLMPEDYLTPVVRAGWAPGESEQPPTNDGSPVWIMAVAPTRVYVDYDGNPATGALTDPTGRKYDEHHDVDAFESLRIFDPDLDQTGMQVYSVDGVKLAGAWGEDPTEAVEGNPFLDVGYSLLNASYVPVIEVLKSGPASAAVGETVTYTFAVRHAAGSDGSPLSELTVVDNVAGGVTLVSQTGGDADNLLESGETWNYSVTYTVPPTAPDPLVNIVTASGRDRDGDAVSDTDTHSLHVLGLGTIGDRVWRDENGNGVQDAGEDGIAGVVLTLAPPPGVDLGAGDGVAITTTTGSNGGYLFTDLPPNVAYTVTVTPPAGMDQTADPDSTLDHTTVVTLWPGEERLDTDFGYLPPLPPVAVNDARGNIPAGAVMICVTNNDTDPNNNLVVTTVDLDPDADGQQMTRTVAGEGLWTVSTTYPGYVLFTPAAGFTKDPTPIPYTVKDGTPLTSNAATITLDYRPVATNDTSTGNEVVGGVAPPVTVDVLANDKSGDLVDRTTMMIVGSSGPMTELVVAGQGTWSVLTTGPDTGQIRFAPASGFTGDPTPIRYTAKDTDGNSSNSASVTIDYVRAGSACTTFPFTLVIDDLSTPGRDIIIVDNQGPNAAGAGGLKSTVADGSPTVTGELYFSGTTAKFSLARITARSKPLVGTTAEPENITLSAAFRSATGGTIVVEATDSCYEMWPGGTHSLTTPLGGTTNGSVTFTETVDLANRPFIVGAPGVSNTLGPYGAGAVSGSKVTYFTSPAYVSMDKKLTVTHPTGAKLTTMTAGGLLSAVTEKPLTPALSQGAREEDALSPARSRSLLETSWDRLPACRALSTSGFQVFPDYVSDRLEAYPTPVRASTSAGSSLGQQEDVADYARAGDLLFARWGGAPLGPPSASALPAAAGPGLMAANASPTQENVRTGAVTLDAANVHNFLLKPGNPVRHADPDWDLPGVDAVLPVEEAYWSEDGWL